ncbi:uncharacterized protein B0T23DRAFT_314466, partial [Neurospora hispaniola]
ITSVNTVGSYIPIYFIFKINPTKEFTINDLPSNIRFIKLPTGFSSIEIIFNWLKYFNLYSFEVSLTFKKTGYSFMN